MYGPCLMLDSATLCLYLFRLTLFNNFHTKLVDSTRFKEEKGVPKSRISVNIGENDLVVYGLILFKNFLKRLYLFDRYLCLSISKAHAILRSSFDRSGSW